MKVSMGTVNAFGYIGLSVLVILAVLVWMGQVPDYLQLPVLCLALTLLLVRVTLRLLAQRTKRIAEEESRKTDAGRSDDAGRPE